LNLFKVMNSTNRNLFEINSKDNLGVGGLLR
jgi:hypothetical protein